MSSLRANLVIPTEFPILSFDESVLSPALGHIFNPRWLDPHESIVSILWKFGKANSLPGHILTGLLRAHVDPYEGVDATRDAVDLHRLRASLNLPIPLLRGALIPPVSYRVHSPFLRFCPACLSRGYHCVAYQFEALRICPIHQRALEIACRACGHMAPYRLNAAHLNTPYRCSQCRALYGNAMFSELYKRPMKKKDQVLMFRLHFKYLFC